MEWLKKGKIDYSRWMHINKYASDFATLPTPIAINNEIIRIFIGFCDNNNVGTISYIDVLADNPSEVVNISESRGWMVVSMITEWFLYQWYG